MDAPEPPREPPADRAPAAPPVAAARRRLGATPLSLRLVAVLLLLVTTGLVVVGVVSATALRGYLVDRLDAQLRGAAAEVVRRPGPGGPRRGGVEFLNTYYVRYADAAGATLASYGPETVPPPDLAEPTAADAAATRGRPFTVDAVEGGSRWRVVLLPVRRPAGGQRSGVATVAVGLVADDVDRTVRRLVAVELGVGAGVLVLVAVLGHALVRSSLRPLVEVERTAAAIAAGDLGRRVPERDPGTEVGRLTVALNGMLRQIESAFRARTASERAARASEQRMRRFVADASHELRTPLTSIRGFAELYRQGAVRDPEEVARLLRRVEDEAARMGLLVDDLLLLARLDRDRPLDAASVDLLVLAADAVHDAVAVAPDRDVRLVVADGSAPPVVVGDEARLRQVLGNLVGNALAHTPPGSPVRVTLAADDAEVVLEVSDEGPGMTPEQAEQAFERFYRADPARARAQGGAGLGLSIVAGIVEAHGGAVSVDTAPGEGATFRVRLPRAAEPR